MTDDELNMLKEKYRRLGNDWTNQCRIAQAAKDRANEMFRQHSRLGMEISNEYARRYKELDKLQHEV